MKRKLLYPQHIVHLNLDWIYKNEYSNAKYLTSEIPMTPLIIPATENTPAVTLNAEEQIFILEGESYPESAHKFYQPIISWLEEYTKVLHHQKQYFEKNRRMTFQFKLSYFNSTSAKYIYEIISLLDELTQNGLEIRVKWFYNKEDIDMKESGEELAKGVKKLNIKFVESMPNNQQQ